MNDCNMVVSISRGTLKWVVYRENPIKNDDLGVPIFWETSILNKQKYNDCHLTKCNDPSFRSVEGLSMVGPMVP